MKLLYSSIVVTLFLFGCESADKSHSSVSGSNTPGKSHTNYGHNIVVAIDLSNRIKESRKYDDAAIVRIITNNLRDAFEKGIEAEINGKFMLTTINSNDFGNDASLGADFRIDLTRFEDKPVERANYLYHNKGKNSLQYDLSQVNETFSRLYNRKKESGNWLPADMWYFLRDKLTFPTVDTSSSSYELDKVLVVNKRRNYIIILTDGYIEANRYKEDRNMRKGNTFRYLSSNVIEEFRKNYNNNSYTSIDDYFTDKKFGIMPVSNPLLKDCKILVLELFDRSVINGHSTKTPTDMEILKTFWSDWLIKSGVPKANFDIQPTRDNAQDVNIVVRQFLDLN
jgi:hypothetical protein